MSVSPSRARRERMEALAQQVAVEEKREARERHDAQVRRARELERRDREVRRLRVEARERLAGARRAFENADIDFEALAGQLGFGRVSEDAVLAAGAKREDARARLEVWDLAARALDGDPAIRGRR